MTGFGNNEACAFRAIRLVLIEGLGRPRLHLRWPAEVLLTAAPRRPFTKQPELGLETMGAQPVSNATRRLAEITISDRQFTGL